METTTSCLKRDVRRVSCQIWFCELLCFYSVIHPVSQKVLLHSFFEVSFANECNLVRASALALKSLAGTRSSAPSSSSRSGAVVHLPPCPLVPMRARASAIHCPLTRTTPAPFHPRPPLRRPLAAVSSRSRLAPAPLNPAAPERHTPAWPQSHAGPAPPLCLHAQEPQRHCPEDARPLRERPPRHVLLALRHVPAPQD